MKTIEVVSGENIWDVARRLVEAVPASADFNGTEVFAFVGDEPEGVVARYFDKRQTARTVSVPMHIGAMLDQAVHDFLQQPVTPEGLEELVYAVWRDGRAFGEGWSR